MTSHQHTINVAADGITYVEIIGDGNVDDAKGFVADCEKIFVENPGKVFDTLVDMRKSGFSDLAGIDVYRQFLKSDRIGRTAFVFANPGVEFMAKMALSEKNNEQVGFFRDPAEAKSWLLGN